MKYHPLNCLITNSIQVLIVRLPNYKLISRSRSLGAWGYDPLWGWWSPLERGTWLCRLASRTMHMDG